MPRPTALTSGRPTVDPTAAEPAKIRLQAARAKAISSVTPYLGTALTSMVMHPVPGLGTVATDTRWRFYYDPAVVADWSLGMCIAAWLHELKHNLHRHGERFEALGEPATRHPLFNLAGDAFINEDLRDLKAIAARGPDPVSVELGDDWVFFETLPVAADRMMLTEQVYRMLFAASTPMCPLHLAELSSAADTGERPPDQIPGGANVADSDDQLRLDGRDCTCGQLAGVPSGHDCGSGAGSRHVDRWWELPQDDGSDGSVDDGRGQLVAYDAARQIGAHEKQHGRGSVPAGLSRWANEILDPAVDWRAELRSVVSNRCAAVAGRRDYTYRRPSRRRAPAGLILPSMVAPSLPNGAIVLDTSASMSSDELAQGVAEVAGILKQASRSRSKLKVIACDVAASQAKVVRDAADVELVGGGGTDMRVGMNAAAAIRPRMDFVVVFTDGDTPWPAEPPAQNRSARYIAVLSDGDRPGVPAWIHKIAVGYPQG